MSRRRTEEQAIGISAASKMTVLMCMLQGSQLENVLSAQRQKFVQMIARELHRDQPWFHGSIERETADMVMLESGHHDGKFL